MRKPKEDEIPVLLAGGIAAFFWPAGLLCFAFAPDRDGTVWCMGAICLAVAILFTGVAGIVLAVDLGLREKKK